MAKKKPAVKIFPKLLKTLKRHLLPISLSAALFMLVVLTYQVMVMDRFYPLTFVGDQNISFLTKEAAAKKIAVTWQKRAAEPIDFNSPQQAFELKINSSFSWDPKILDEAFIKQHSGNFFQTFSKQLQLLVFSDRLDPKISFDLDNAIEAMAAKVKRQPQDAQLLYSESVGEGATPSANIQIKNSQDGLELDAAALQKQVRDYLLSGKFVQYLPTRSVAPKISTANVIRAKQALENLQKNSLQLKFEGSLWLLDTKQLLTLLDFTSQDTVPLDQNKTRQFILSIASQINQDVQEGLFEFNPQTKRVSAFKPSQDGRKLDEEKTYQALVEALKNPAGGNTINLPVDIVQPKTKTADVNSLGIKELIGRGISNFAGSIPNRIYNVNLTAQKLNGVLVPPGEIFSFNKTVGDITAATGFKQAYVIKEGRTVLDDGGGVCQDSTTLFRAVLNAGLPVVKRTAHAYRVGYYEQGFPPGLDATVFYPSVDFQFKNDTLSYILIQSYTSGTTLYVDLYGTSDGRVATISRSIVTNQTPPPPDLRQDDPTLPKGTVKQVDWSAWGANVYFKRTVFRGGKTFIDETWYSSYKPWQAVYLVGIQ